MWPQRFRSNATRSTRRVSARTAGRARARHALAPARDDANAVTNPTLIIEVLSESTEASDRGEKFAHLQRLLSLQEYVLVTQHERRVEVFRRGEGLWTFHTFTTGRVELKSVGAFLELDDVYADPLAAS